MTQTPTPSVDTPWYIIQARGDLDDDKTFSLFHTVIDSSIIYKQDPLE